ncbi:MAG TPA: FAD-binding oxidoreductase [Ohtaekwangia sp.]|nr:FAD-binding oxidoreductase [Ohtaekwangia sp.]
MKNITNALRAWTRILTTKRVLVNDVAIQSVSKATFRTTQKIRAVLKPVSSREVSLIIKIARRYNIPVYPVSGGKNWGLGSKVPQQDGVLIDLSLMKKITRYNEAMAYITVEPGVTFKAVIDFLDRKKSGLMLDSIGSTPDASIIGNTAERGHGMALYADRFNYVCGMEVVLPNGDIIETGFENISGTKLGPLAKWGLGPYVDGLFTQSNLGIITRLTLWLRPKPAFFQSFIFHIHNEDNLGRVMEQWRQMSLDGLQSSLRVFNDIRMISFQERFPEGEEVPLSDKKRAALREKYNIGKWIGLGALYPVSEQHASADKAYIKGRIGDLVDDLVFYDQQKADEELTSGGEARRKQLDFMFYKSLLRGNVSGAGINMTYWRKSTSVPVKEVHEDGCGVIWYCPAIPFTGKDTLKAIKIGTRICKKYGFELNIGFLFISQRVLDITGAICYDRNTKGEDQRAMACHDELMDAMTKAGYSPYRLGIQSMKLMKLKSSNSTQFIRQLKEALDDKNILAPGHYVKSEKK